MTTGNVIWAQRPLPAPMHVSASFCHGAPILCWRQPQPRQHPAPDSTASSTVSPSAGARTNTTSSLLGRARLARAPRCPVAISDTPPCFLRMSRIQFVLLHYCLVLSLNFIVHASS